MALDRAVALLVLGVGMAWSQPLLPNSVRASGEGVVYAKPDQVRIDLGVVTQAATAEAAASKNATQLQAVLDKLRASLGPKADIKTISYSLRPDYQYPRDGSKPAITGYTAVNTVRLTSEDLANVGKWIDAATQAGANEVERLQFLLKDEKPARAEALRQAAVEARSNAEAMAAALGMKAGKVITMEQGSLEPVRPMVAMMEARAPGPPTPVQPGSIEVRATVILVVSLQ